MAKFIVEIVNEKKGVFQGKFTEGLKFKNNEAYGNTVEECLKDLVFRMEQESLDTEEARFKHYLKAKRSMGFNLAKMFLQTVGNGWFDIKTLLNAVEGEDKESLLLKLEFLQQFCFIEVDRPDGAGKRYRVIMSDEERDAIIDEQIKDLRKSIEGLEYMRGAVLEKPAKQTWFQKLKQKLKQRYNLLRGEEQSVNKHGKKI